jgi:hypothetical protein
MDSALRLCKMSSTNASKGRNWTSISGLDNNTLDNCYIGVGPHRNQGPSDPLPTAPKGRELIKRPLSAKVGFGGC